MKNTSRRLKASKLGLSAGSTGPIVKNVTPQTKCVDVANEIVDLTSNDSFPTSVSPAWINGREPRAGFNLDHRAEEAIQHSLSRVPDPRRPAIKVTKQNVRDLKSLFAINPDRSNWRSVEYLVRELMRATVFDEDRIPTNVVTMGSRVEYLQAGKNSTQVVTLSYPDEMELFRDGISILTPVGAALIGLSAGQSISYTDRDGFPITIKVVKVLHQPEADRRGRFRRRPRRSPRVPVRL